MGATRRLNHYDSSMGWQGLFIVSGVGLLIIGAGVGFTVLQLVVSVFQRKKNIDKTGDPWDGRTLEWATSSPAKIYNFAVIPNVYARDAFWVAKTAKVTGLEKPKYHDIEMPKNTPLAVIIAGLVTLVGFCVVWHIWWLAILAFVGIVVTIIVRSFDDHTEYVIPAKTVALLETSKSRGAIYE